MDENGFCCVIGNFNTGFEKHYDNWKQTDEDAFDWRKHSGPVFSNYGPANAYEGNYYMYFKGVELAPYLEAIFESPLIQYGTTCNVKIDFAYYLHYGYGNPSSLRLQASYNGGEEWSTIWSSAENNPPPGDVTWHIESVLATGNINKLRFVAKNAECPNYSNIGIDDVTISKVSALGPMVIQGTTEFSGEVHTCGDIIIEPNAKLFLTPGCKLYMPENHKIVVKRSGWLIVDEATITNYGQGFWKGLEVWGTCDQPQNPLYQGIIQIMNNSIIENAECAIKTTKTDEMDGNEIPEYSGGIVWVYSGSKLLNNKQSARFLPYTGGQSQSKFTDAIIQVDDRYLGNEVEDMIVMNLIDGIWFTRVIVEDLRSEIPVLEKPTGIRAVGCNFVVAGTFNPNSYNCKFNNLLYGIKSIGILPNDILSVSQVEFNNNLRGIYCSATTGSIFKTNHLIAFENASPFLENYGLYLDVCTGYEVTNNNFENTHTTRKGNGLVINNSGNNPNEVYHNTFQGLDYAILAQNKNRSRDGRTGLCLKCNDFNECNSDITILTDIQEEDPQLGIAANQGSGSSNPNDMAGNLFFIESQIPDDDFDDINNQLQHINYYFPSNAQPPYNLRVRPIDFTNRSVTTIPMDTEPRWSYDANCPPKQDDGEPAGLYELIQKLIESQQKSDSVQSILDLLVDAGNTEAMYLDVNNGTSQQALDLYSDMMNVSPYLSDSVVAAAIINEDVFPGAMIRDIMVANPSSAKSDKLMTELDQRWEPLPDYMKAQILNGRSLVSIREQTESILTGWKTKQAVTLNSLYRYYLNDTININASSMMIDSLLLINNNLHSIVTLAFRHLKAGNIQSGAGLLDSLSQQFSLTMGEQHVIEQLQAYYNIMVDLKQDSLDIFRADSSIIVALYGIMNTDDELPGNLARNALIALRQTDYLEPVLIPDMFKSTEAFVNYNKLLNIQLPVQIKVIPNPAKDYIIVQYQVENPFDALFKIHTLQGIPVFCFNITCNQDQTIINTHSWESGIYMVTLIQNGISVESQKFSIIR